ncbi:MAG: magnesium transporter CorA family protein [Candidatus Yanofskybacteria bacterium]|nr:magnesium transporter CorA family protein [Candidatus Yanofskybacteria bacterium]
MNHSEKIYDEPIAGVPWRTIRMSAGNGFKHFAEAEGYHSLDIEDCYHKRQIAKVVERDHYVFIVVKIARFEAKTLQLTFDDFDMFIRPDSLVTVEEHPGTLVDRVRERFPRTDDHKIDTHHLVYALLDEIVDYYLVTLDGIGESIHSLEGDIWKNPSPQMLEKIFKIKRSLIDFRRNAGGMREVVSLLVRHPRIKTDGDLENYYRDLYEHAIRVIEFIETYRDTLNSSLDVYLSAIAQKTNEISKVLAVYGTIALPFLVLTGLYGMNIPLPFQESPHAFFIVFGSMASLAMVALYFFKRKNWF